MTTTYSHPLVDEDGAVMFYCGYCCIPLTADDLGELGFRMPESGESRDEYFEAELIDDLRHRDCVQGAHAS